MSVNSGLPEKRKRRLSGDAKRKIKKPSVYWALGIKDFFAKMLDRPAFGKQCLPEFLSKVRHPAMIDQSEPVRVRRNVFSVAWTFYS